MGTRHHYRRSDLFLLRVWSDEPTDGHDQVEWRGKLQRIVDGESHQFNDWQDLVDLLLAMLSDARRAPALDDSAE